MDFFRIPFGRVPVALWRVAVDRSRARRVPGVRFAKLLGSGDGRTFDPRDADLTLWAVLVVWEDPEAARQHVPVLEAWQRLASEHWRAELEPLSARGAWSGTAPFGDPRRRDPGGLVAAITRARLRPTRMLRFWRAVPPVTRDLHTREGLLLAIGIGEAPIGVQGTFSVWTSAEALTAFAYGGAAHREAIRRTATDGWYAEELFARFAVRVTTGTLRGRDPLAG